MIYFTSDLHFGHSNAIQLCARPFMTVEEMNNALVTNWNNRVRDNDEVYILGDLSLAKKWEVVHNYVKQLKGKKHLIRGNHDRFLKDSQFTKHTFEQVTDYLELEYQGHLFVLCHYPLWDWKDKDFGAIHLYGHIHAKDSAFLQEQFGRCFHVGVDSNDYRPISIDEVLERVKDVNKVGFLNELFCEQQLVLGAKKTRG